MNSELFVVALYEIAYKKYKEKEYISKLESFIKLVAHMNTQQDALQKYMDVTPTIKVKERPSIQRLFWIYEKVLLKVCEISELIQQ
jgi:hypothetical protein